MLVQKTFDNRFWCGCLTKLFKRRNDSILLRFCVTLSCGFQLTSRSKGWITKPLFPNHIKNFNVEFCHSFLQCKQMTTPSYLWQSVE
jgi:hypothetical protein